MKKITGIFMGVIMMLSMLSMAMAHEDEVELEESAEISANAEESTTTDVSATATTLTVDSETEAEAESAVSTHGAKVRLLQLEKAITVRLEAGKAVIAAIKANSTANTTKLDEILAELEALKIQVSQVTPSGDGKEAAKAYVELKADAIELTQQFRKEAKVIIKAENLEGIRASAKAKADKADVKAVQEKIKAEKNAHNAERLQKVLDSMGATNAELVAKVAAGEATMAEVSAYLKQQFSSFGKEHKKEALSRLKEEISERKVQRRALVEDFKANFSVRKEARIEKRAEKILDKSMRERVKVSARARLNNVLDMRSEKKEERKETRIEKKEERKEDATERKETRQGTRQDAGVNAGVNAASGVNV